MIKNKQQLQEAMTKKLTRTVPPKRGPQPQGVEYNYNTVKTVKLEKRNGNNRQVTTQRD